MQVASSLFIRSLVDDYILPLTAAARPDFGPLAAALLKLSFVSFLGVFFAWMYNRLMVDIGQGTMMALFLGRVSASWSWSRPRTRPGAGPKSWPFSRRAICRMP